MKETLVFDSVTFRGVAMDRPAGPGEFSALVDNTDRAWFRETPGRYQYVAGVFSEWPGWAAEQEAKAIAEAKAKAEADIRATGSSQLLALGKPYSAEERETWITQESEARAWVADNSVSCPMITAMAITRGITVELMAQKIIENADLFKVMAGQILGAQQKAIDEVI